MRPILLLSLLVACADPSATPDPGAPTDERPVLGTAGDPVWDEAQALLADGRGRADGWRAEVDAARAAAAELASPCTDDVAWRGGVGFPSVQEAFDVASPDPVVLVCAGEHREEAVAEGEGELRIVAPLVAGSEVVFDGEGEHPALQGVLGSSLVLVDLTVRNATAALVTNGPTAGLLGCTIEASGTSDRIGGAVRIGRSEVAVLVGNRFVGNDASLQGAVEVSAGSVVVADNVFEDNHATRGVAALQIHGSYAAGEVAVALAGNVFERNLSDELGPAALDFTTMGLPLRGAILGDVFRGNDGDDGAVRMTPKGGAVGLYDVTFEDNATGDRGLGAVLSLGDWREPLEASLVRTRFEGNEGGANGIVDVDASGGTFLLADVVLEGNRDNGGPAIAFHDAGAGRVELWDVDIVGNETSAALQLWQQHDLEASAPDRAHVHGGRIAGNTTFHEALVSETWDLVAVGVDFGDGADDNTGGDVAGCGALGAGATVIVAPDGTTTCR